MDYPNRRRLKIYACIEVIEAKDAPELIEKLQGPGYDARVERAIPLRVEFFDWNCPKNITPRYTLEEIEELIVPLRMRIEELEAELATRPKADENLTP